MNRRHPSPSFSLATVALLCALAFPAQAANPADFIALAPAQAKALGVETRPLAAADTGSAAGLPAKVVVPVEQMRVVAAPLAGLLTQVGAVAGQTVKKGQMLARLASPGLLQVQRDYLQARQQADLAQRSLARDEQLFKEGIIAEARLQASRASQAQAAVAARELQAELRIAGATASGVGGGAEARATFEQFQVALTQLNVETTNADDTALDRLRSLLAFFASLHPAASAPATAPAATATPAVDSNRYV